MRTADKILDYPERYADLPLLVMMVGLITCRIASGFRFTTDWHFLYPLGNITAMFLLLISLLLAFVFIIAFTSDIISKKGNPSVISLLLSCFPFLYILIVVILDN